MEYSDFKLIATNVHTVIDQSKVVKFQLQVSESPVGEIIQPLEGEYDVPKMREYLEDWETRELDWKDVISVGIWLSEALFPGPVRELLVRSIDLARVQKRGLRLRLLLDGDLNNVPWEYVLLNRGGKEATNTDFLGLFPDVSIVRHQAATLPNWGVQAELPANLLVALSSPKNFKPVLQLDEEKAAIEDALKDNHHIHAKYVERATQKTLFAGVKQAHLFHFAGHGTFPTHQSHKPGSYEGEGMLILDDGFGDPYEVAAGTLAVQLQKLGVRVAVVGACKSGRRDNINAWSGVATAFLKAELGAVVGMQYNIRNDSATEFAREVYAALAAGLPIDEAVTNGRIAMSTQDVRGWGVPVLFLRAADGMIFPEYRDKPELEFDRENLRVKARQRIQELYGNAVTVKIEEVMSGGSILAKQQIGTAKSGSEGITAEIDTMTGGSVDADQGAGTVEKGASLTAIKIKNLGGGLVSATQEADNVEGNMTGVDLDNL